MNSLEEIRERDAISAATWFKAPNTGPARAFQDRRWLLAEVDRLRRDIQELTCGDPRLVCPNCRPAPEPQTGEQT